MINVFGTELAWYTLAAIAVIGTVVGVINTLAGSGSLITLPIFMFVFGLPANVANATNRIGALLQSALGAAAFRRANPEGFQHSVWLIVPAIFGGLIGAIVAARASAEHMRWAITILMGVMLVLLIVNPNRWIRESAPDRKKNRSLWSGAVFFAIGFYGGFIQAGVGIFLLAGLVLIAQYSLRDANAIKLAIVTLLSVPAIAVFAWEGQIHYALGTLMAAFQMLGAVIGVWLAKRVPRINIWIHRLLIVMVAVSLITIVIR
jgi:uncharacterized membrane protein YfcA